MNTYEISMKQFIAGHLPTVSQLIHYKGIIVVMGRLSLSFLCCSYVCSFYWWKSVKDRVICALSHF